MSTSRFVAAELSVLELQDVLPLKGEDGQKLATSPLSVRIRVGAQDGFPGGFITDSQSLGNRGARSCVAGLQVGQFCPA
jgi:hypothetical protein